MNSPASIKLVEVSARMSVSLGSQDAVAGPQLSSVPESFTAATRRADFPVGEQRVRAAFQRCLPERSVCLRDSGEVAPSAPQRWLR